MHWLIVEDALRDHKGHWFEYIRTFRDGLLELGAEVTLLAERNAEPFIESQLNAKLILPPSIWHRMSESAPVWKRCARIPLHGWKTWRCVRRWLKAHNTYDLIFVPTVLIHHLLGWALLVKATKVRPPVLLFFPNLPIRLDSANHPEWAPSPTTRLFVLLIRWLKPEIVRGRVILGVETNAMREALSTLTDLPVCYFPHPVSISASQRPIGSSGVPLRFGCYGPARHEKGSDLLIKAISQYLERFPKSRVHFAFQWLEDFRSDTGDMVRVDPTLVSNGRVEIISRYFGEGEYPKILSQTDALLLPYRHSSYCLRVSRVVIEAMVNAIPVVATRGTTLSDQVRTFGSGVFCEDGDVNSLVEAIRKMEESFDEWRRKAEQQRAKAQEHFSVANFCGGLLKA